MTATLTPAHSFEHKVVRDLMHFRLVYKRVLQGRTQTVRRNSVRALRAQMFAEKWGIPWLFADVRVMAVNRTSMWLVGETTPRPIPDNLKINVRP